MIVTQKNEEAKVINFDRKLTIITGDNPDGTTINRTGKSLVMKSIYHALGSKISKYTSNWVNLQIATILTFEFDDNLYEIYRNKDNFILTYNEKTVFFKNISELREFYVELFNFRIRMPISKNDDNVVYAYPGGFFLPFYVDQDKGWSGSWDSFSDVFGGKWKSEILLYHMGVRTPKYYDLLDEKIELETLRKDKNNELKTLNLMTKNHMEKYKDFLNININLEDFSKDIIRLTDELNRQQHKRNQIKEELISCYNEMKEFEELYIVAEKVHNELLKDIDYIESNITDEKIMCPTCGTTHDNSIQTHFNLYTEIDECENVMNKYFVQRAKIEARIKKQSEELATLDDYIKKINKILNQKRDNITFKEVIVSEGSKTILDDLKEESNQVQQVLTSIETRLKEITKEQTAITKAGKDITNRYLDSLKSNIGYLGITDISETDIKKFTPQFNSGGNDLPCAVISQVYALYDVMSKYSKSVCAPIVLDAIFQQEPTQEKIELIWDFLISKQPKDSQLIISTAEMHGVNVEGKIIKLLKEKGLFNSEDYKIEKQLIEKYKNLLLEYLKS